MLLDVTKAILPRPEAGVPTALEDGAGAGAIPRAAMEKDSRLSFRIRSRLKKTLETIAASEGDLEPASRLMSGLRITICSKKIPDASVVVLSRVYREGFYMIVRQHRGEKRSDLHQIQSRANNI